MVGPLRQSLLAVLAVALLMAFSGCLGNLSPEAEANLVDTLTGSDEEERAEESPVEPAPEPAVETETGTATDVLESEPPVVVSAPEPIAPRRSFVVEESAPASQAPSPVFQTLINKPSKPQPTRFSEAPVAEPVGPVDPGEVDVDVPTLPTGTLVDSFKAWPISLQGAEYASGCVADGQDCAYFDIPAAAQGKEFTMEFQAAVPAVAYFIDLYAGDAYVATYGDPTGAFGAFSSDPIPGYGPGGNAVYTNEVPNTITQFRVYATGGADFVAHLVIGETDCPSDPYAIGSPTAGLWVTPFDSSDGSGAVWVYPETNDEPGLQRSDATFGTTCGNADAWLI